MTPVEIGQAAAEMEKPNTIIIELTGAEFDTTNEAVQALDAEGWDHAILFAGKNMSVTQETVDMLFDQGLHFAYLAHHAPTNRVMTIPAY